MNCIPLKGLPPLRSGWAAAADPVWARPPVKVTRVPKPAAAAASGPDLKAARCLCTALDGVKILGGGELTKKLTVQAAKFSASAKEKIEAVGGKAEVI